MGDQTTIESPPPSKLTQLLERFDKSSLRKTDTKVTTVDGRQIVEGKDDGGRMVVKSVITGELGYVGDLWQDLQVGEVLPGLIMGVYALVAKSSNHLSQTKLFSFYSSVIVIAEVQVEEHPTLIYFLKYFECDICFKLRKHLIQMCNSYDWKIVNLFNIMVCILLVS